MSDITCQFGYVDIETETGWQKEPAIGIKPAKLGRVPIYAIPLSSAYLYADSQYLMRASFNVATFLGMFPDAFLINRIADLILSRLPDLIRMKPFRQELGSEIGEGRLFHDGDVVEHFGITTGGMVLK